MNTKSFVSSILIGLGLFSMAAGQSKKAKAIDEFVRSFVEANQFAGEILVSEDGKVTYEKAFGIANADYKIPNRLDTRIGVASITKLMTKVILARLVESKQISLADKLSKYISDFPNGDKITIEMLARHRSGIPHRVMPPEAESVAYSSAEFIEKVKLAKLAFEPGTQTLYSSAGFSVLARCLEIASGKPYVRLIQEYVFTPADMKDSRTFDGESIMERRAQDYFFSPEGYLNAPLKDYSFLVGAGSVFSTAHDMNNFANAVLDGKFGEGAKASLIGDTVLEGSGNTNGHRAYLEMERNKKYGYVIISNLSAGTDTIKQGISDILHDKPLTVRYIAPPKTDLTVNKDLGQFVGHFKRADGVETDIVVSNIYLYAGDIKLYPIKPDCFFEYKFSGDACFVRDAGGKVTTIKWVGPGFDLTWVKQ